MSITVPTECKHCRALTTEICPTCHGAFCDMCASQIDTAYCKLCLNADSTNVREEPLVDDEGVVHTGRVVIPVGNAYKTLPKQISEMSDYELGTFIDHHKELLHQSERAVDFHRISVGMAEMEKGDRDYIARKKLRGVKVAVGGRRITAGSGGNGLKGITTKVDPAALAEQLKAAGLTPEALLQLVTAVRKAKEAKTQ